MTGLAATSASVDPTAANTAAGAAVDNNWLATQQIVQYKKELAEAKGAEVFSVFAKWAFISSKQDVLTQFGVGKGLASAGWNDVEGLAQFVANPIEGLKGLKELIANPEVQKQFRAEFLADANKKIDTITNALEVGGDKNAEALGVALGEVAWQVGSIVTGVGTAAKGVAGLAKAGIKVGAAELDKMADLAKMEKLAKAEAARNRVVGAIADSQEARAGSNFGQFAKTEGELRDALAAKNATTPVIKIEASKVEKGSPEYDALNNLKANSSYELDNGTTFITNSHGYVEDITFTPTLTKVPRDARQTAVGKEGLSTDVGGHVQACSLGGTCDRYNLFPQDQNFNNSAYKKFENQLRNALEQGDNVGPVNVTFRRLDAGSPRPDSLVVKYTINGEPRTRRFKNQNGG
ncbi:Uncharacterized protein ALO76_01153 [Pseudomonas syringae pv. coriandricola]|nr:Uncharacterized protein ALO76_01153 [Pseudomonas syringae pv. coriandricola]